RCGSRGVGWRTSPSSAGSAGSWSAPFAPLIAVADRPLTGGGCRSNVDSFSLYELSPDAVSDNSTVSDRGLLAQAALSGSHVELRGCGRKVASLVAVAVCLGAEVRHGR